MTHLPRDRRRTAIPALGLRPGGAHRLDAVTTGAVAAGPFDAGTRVVMVVPTVAVTAQTGDATVSAGTADHHLPAGVPMFVSLGGRDDGRATHLSVRGVDAPGPVYVSELT